MWTAGFRPFAFADPFFYPQRRVPEGSRRFEGCCWDATWAYLLPWVLVIFWASDPRWVGSFWFSAGIWGGRLAVFLFGLNLSPLGGLSGK